METNKNYSYIGLDVGERRIGVARINDMVGIAEPLDVIDATESEVIDNIRSTVSIHQADAIVVGLPRGLDGQETEQTVYCREFALDLKNKMQIPVYMIDEAGTSLAADDIIAKTKNNFSRDSVAAAIMLEDFVTHKNKEEVKI